MNRSRLAPGLSNRARRRAALIAALTLPLSLMNAPAIAQGPAPLHAVAAETVAGTTDPTLEAAWDQAAKIGKPVEVPSRFTETMKVWANPDGKNMRAEMHTRPVQLKNQINGAWEPIDPRIVTRDGKLQAARVKTPLTFGARGAKHLVSAAEEHGEIGLGVTRALPEPKVSGNAVTYPDAVAPGADLVVLAQADGFISQVVFRQRPTGPVTVRLPLTLPAGTAFGKTPQGLPQLKDAKGAAEAAPVVLTATDAKVETAPEQGRTSSVKARVETTGKTSELVFTPDETFLADPAVTYPVTVAASSIWFGGGAPDDAWVSRNDPANNNAAAGYLRAGTTSTSADVARVYLKFNTSDPALQGATVNDADLRIWNYKSGGPNGQLCGENVGAGIRASRVTSAWTLTGSPFETLDWTNQPTSTAPETVNEAGYNYDADPGTWCAKDEELFYEVTAMTRAWIEQGATNHGIVLKAASETAAINWRQYYSSQFGGGEPYPGYRHPPALIIDYEPGQLVETGFVTDRTLPDDFTPSDVAAELADSAAPEVVDTTIERERAIARETQIGALNGITEPMEYAPDGIDPAEPDPGTPTPPPTPAAPAATNLRAEPVTVIDGAPVITSLTPKLLAQPFDAEDRPSQVDFELAHDPAHGAQGSGTIWSAQHDNVANGGQAQVEVPAGTLTDGWYVQARVRATAGGVVGGWSEWQNFLVDLSPTTPTPSEGLVASYGLNEGSGTSVADSSGNDNAGAGTGTAWVNGKYGKALSFDGSSSMVTVADAPSLRLTTGMTLSAWVNPVTVTGTPWKSVITKELNADGASYALYAANGDAVPSGWVQTDPATPWTAEGTSPLPVNAWSHLALTYDGTTLRLFVNGQQVGHTAMSGSLHDDGHPLRIGGNTVWREYFSGLIDEVRVYDRAQSAAEIQTDMTTPIGQAAPPDTQAPTAPGSLAATGGTGSAQLTWTASTDNVGVTGYRIHRATTPGFTPSDANQVGSVPATTFTDAGLAAGTYYYRVRATDAAGNLGPSSTEVSATVTVPPANPGLVAAYGMEEGTGTTVGDSSGQSNTGAATDTAWAPAGKHGKALSFDGASSWVTVPHAQSLRLTNALTLSAWVNPATAAGWRTVLMKENGSGASYGLYAAADGGPLGWLQNASGSKSVVGDDPLPLNQWSHLAVTYNGTIITLYLNGTQIDQTPMTGNLADSGGVLRLGGNDVWEDEFYSGLIDEVRVYNRVQTAAEIQADMNTPVGAASTSSAVQRRSAAAGPAGIAKLTVDDSRPVAGVTVASTLTPRLTTWLPARRDGEAKVDVEIARPPTKSGKTAKVTTDKLLIWSGQTTAKPGDSRVTLRVPKGRLQAGERVRWRARVTGTGDRGTWSGWQSLSIQERASDGHEPQASEARKPQVSAALDPYTPNPILNVNECIKYPASGYANEFLGEDHKPYGFVKNRFTWCKWGWGWRYAGPSQSVVTDKMRFRYTLIGQTFQGSRDIAIRLNIDGWQNVQGSYFATADATAKLRFGLNFKAPCQSKYNPAAIDPVFGHSQTHLWWKNNPEVWFWLTAPKPGASPTNPDFLGTCEISPWIQYETLPDPRVRGISRPWRQPLVAARDSNGKAIAYGVRCDTARKMKGTSGCVFSRVTPWLQFAKSDAAVWVSKGPQYRWLLESWEHFDTAEKRPHLTIPHHDGKSFPGFSKKRPLHRIVDDARIREQRQASTTMCRWGWPNPDDREGLSCDEYPFASTKEGALSGGPISVDMIPVADNTGFGLYVLGPWYEKERIIYDDEFYLKIVEQAPPRDF
ncbi:deoxyribonuclease NucA/NucB [Nonomuraea fuscirosea]|uniref:Deoxyribonuclease NucA/NucB n=1 Tax=Nonomuraea fuscirosea TaxID=1291556 RepID=A0A2T0M5E8_9ACTN|nr:LamG-like jellyroll fold domain-containing protein [Nonomuraea fuscirosea]PRX52650.1 deoxyribonuclease NucA/NucB [Nonomuraea fuscirosea]